MTQDARGRIEIDEARLVRAAQELQRAEQAATLATIRAEQRSARAARGPADVIRESGQRILGRLGGQGFIGRLGGIGFALIGADQLAAAARLRGEGKTIAAIVEERMTAFAKGPLRALLRNFIVGLVLDYIESNNKAQQERIDRMFERQREEASIDWQLKNNPQFERVTSDAARRELEQRSDQRRRRRDARYLEGR